MGSRARIALYIPNLIGYGRLALTVVAARYLWVDVRWFLALQCACIVSDAFDGFAARELARAGGLCRPHRHVSPKTRPKRAQGR